MGKQASVALWNISHRTKLDFSLRLTILQRLIEKSEAAIFNDVVISGGDVVEKDTLIWFG